MQVPTLVPTVFDCKAMAEMAFTKTFTGCLLFQFLASCLGNVLLEDPNLFPGHLQPLGEGRKKLAIETVEAFPSPQEFFKKHVNGSKPLLIKGYAKRSPAFKLWDNSYLKELPESATAEVYTEPELKENRTKYGKTVTFKEFLGSYQHETIYLVDDVPKHLRKDVFLPPPLTCEETESLLSMSLMWFSAGGTKSVLHQDFIDNINCLFRGTKSLLMIDKEKYQYKLPLDLAWLKYSAVDIDKVDYGMFPSLREIDEFYLVDMEEGDCLFIPYTWTHQVNSAPNKETKQNVAVNVWFHHDPKHTPCQNSEPKLSLTLSDVEFKVKMNQSDEVRDVGRFLGIIYEEVQQEEVFRVKNLMRQLYFASTAPELRNKYLFKQKPFKKLVRRLFKILDQTNDRTIDLKDFEKLKFVEDCLKPLQIIYNEMIDLALSHAEFQTEAEKEAAIRKAEEQEEEEGGNSPYGGKDEEVVVEEETVVAEHQEIIESDPIENSNKINNKENDKIRKIKEDTKDEL